MLTLIHSNVARVEGGVFVVDRKFYLGMQAYAQRIREPLVTVHPRALPHDRIMDPVEVPLRELGYRVHVMGTGMDRRPGEADLRALEAVVGESRLVYSTGNGLAHVPRRLGVPYMMVLEYDLRTQLTVACAPVRQPLRKAVRAWRAATHYAKDLRDIRAAHAVHCNGYPMHEQMRPFNSNRLLYLDSRMGADMVIPLADLERRLSARHPGARLRLLYSGRYERLKGADHTVRAVLECLRRGLDVELHCYGQGSQHDELVRLAAQAADPQRIRIHAAVAYPELVRRSRGFDAFVCCHIQSDPSCTYLESLGAGLPIVGYDNRMWRGLRQASSAGLGARMRRPASVADAIETLMGDESLLRTLSRNARDFALEHTFEREFTRRTDAVNQALARFGSSAERRGASTLDRYEGAADPS